MAPTKNTLFILLIIVLVLIMINDVSGGCISDSKCKAECIAKGCGGGIKINYKLIFSRKLVNCHLFHCWDSFGQHGYQLQKHMHHYWC
uniref:Uncharacterized protein n=1 Tax=Panagrolaimus sp. ES5 TaxID=591445 RepID=A0AC34G1H9_9BILA